MNTEELDKLALDCSPDRFYDCETQYSIWESGFKTGFDKGQELMYLDIKDRCNPLGLMHYLDSHCPKGKMCLSNMECEDLEKAFNKGDWAKVIRYIHKYE